jgi:hypothetical protein
MEKQRSKSSNLLRIELGTEPYLILSALEFLETSGRVDSVFAQRTCCLTSSKKERFEWAFVPDISHSGCQISLDLDIFLQKVRFVLLFRSYSNVVEISQNSEVIQLLQYAEVALIVPS